MFPAFSHTPLAERAFLQSPSSPWTPGASTGHRTLGQPRLFLIFPSSLGRKSLGRATPNRLAPPRQRVASGTRRHQAGHDWKPREAQSIQAGPAARARQRGDVYVLRQPCNPNARKQPRAAHSPSLESEYCISQPAAAAAPRVRAVAYPKAARPRQPPDQNRAEGPPARSASLAKPRRNACVPQAAASSNPSAAAPAFRNASASGYVTAWKGVALSAAASARAHTPQSGSRPPAQAHFRTTSTGAL